MIMTVNQNTFEDDSHFLMQGLEQEYDFWSYVVGVPNASGYISWNSKWKVTGLEVALTYDL